VNKGVVAKFQLWNPRSMGVLACFLAAHLKAGDQKTDPGTKVSGPGVGEVAFGQNGVIYAGPMITFDKGNIGLFHF